MSNIQTKENTGEKITWEDVSRDDLNVIIHMIVDFGGKVYSKKDNINFFAIRNYLCNNQFNDTLYMFWFENGKAVGWKTPNFTTKPGINAVKGETTSPNIDGVAYICEGWHENIWEIGGHGASSYRALRQTKIKRGYQTRLFRIKPDSKYLENVSNNTDIHPYTEDITVNRDKSHYTNISNYKPIKNNTWEFIPNKINKTDKNGKVIKEVATYTGRFDINFHKSSNDGKNTIGANSAGCQVFQYKNDFYKMLHKAMIAAGVREVLRDSNSKRFIAGKSYENMNEEEQDDFCKKTSGHNFIFDKTKQTRFSYFLTNLTEFNLYKDTYKKTLKEELPYNTLKPGFLIHIMLENLKNKDIEGYYKYLNHVKNFSIPTKNSIIEKNTFTNDTSKKESILK